MPEMSDELARKLGAPGDVMLTDAERIVVARAIEMLGVSHRQVALQGRLLESHGHDEQRVLELLDAGAPESFAPNNIDLEAHARAREELGDRLDSAASAADWIGAVLDFVRVVAL